MPFAVRSLKSILFLLIYASSALADLSILMGSANLTSGAKQSYDQGHGMRILQGTKLDIALLQEFNYGDNSDAALRRFVDMTFGRGFYFYREIVNSDGAIPNGIVSRWPILDYGSADDPSQENRGIAWVKIKLPNGKYLWAVSVHLAHKHEEKRIIGARAVVNFCRVKIPKTDYLVIAGDLNIRSRTEKTMQILGELVSDRHVPVGLEGKDGTSRNRGSPYDVMMPNPLLDQYHSCVEFMQAGEVVLRFEHGAVIDTGTFKPLSLINPAREGDSLAENMQHNLVMKRFVVPD